MKKVVEFDEQCMACGGTGLYVGMAECDGAAVVCTNAKVLGASTSSMSTRTLTVECLEQMSHKSTRQTPVSVSVTPIRAQR